MKLLAFLAVLFLGAVSNAGEWQYYRGQTRHYFVPTGPTRPYYGYIDPNPPRVPLSAIFDPSRTPRGRQYIIDTPSYTHPNGVVQYFPYQLYGQ